MRQRILLLLLTASCFFSFSQSLSFSRKFQAIKKNIPLAILNSRPDCFFVLRYNKPVHDFTIEKRAKPSAEILAFTPLKLDSVNASWFDLENLDYLFFESGKTVCFLFEKVVNTKKTLYLKLVDSLSRSSGFIELASLEKDRAILDFNFSYKTTSANQILITATQMYVNGTVKKTVQLYDIEKRRIIWTKKLPLENNYSGFSSGFECSASGDLYYFLMKSRIVSYKRKYVNQVQVNIPVFFHDSVALVVYPGGDQPLLKKRPVLANVTTLNSIGVSVAKDTVLVQAFSGLRLSDTQTVSLHFLSERLSAGLQELYSIRDTPLEPGVEQALTFYDGSDFKNAGDKEYKFVRAYADGKSSVQVAERRDENYYKELLVWRTDMASGAVTSQRLIPRKVMSFKNRSRFKHTGEAMLLFSDSSLCLIMLEASANLKKDPTAFNYHQFKKETNLWRSNIVSYNVDPKGHIEKKLIYRNAEFDLVPLPCTTSWQGDAVFYLSSGKYERFATWKGNLSGG